MNVLQLTVSFVLLAIGILGISQEHKHLLLSLHNAVRQRILNCSVPNQPPAKAMPILQWHDGLAAKAQNWSDQCTYWFERYEARQLPEFWWVGQNAIGSADVKVGFDFWFNEYKVYNFSSNECRAWCYQYIQLVQKNAAYVGCGVTNCPNRMFPYFIVCNYGESENIDDGHPYERGDFSNCPRLQLQLDNAHG